MKKVGIAVVIIAVIAVAAWQFLAPQTAPTFEDEFSGLKNSWVDAGFEKKNLHSDFGGLIELSEGKLDAIKRNLNEAKKGQEEGALKDLTEVYITLVDIALKTKEVAELNDSIDINADVCDNVALFEQVNEKMVELIELQEAYTKAVDDFAENHQEKSGVIELYKAGSDFTLNKQELEATKTDIELVKELC